MTNLKQSFQAAKYHKRMTLSLFIFFSIFLLILSFLSQLIATQKSNMIFLMSKWDQLKNILPTIDSRFTERLTLSNEMILKLYDHLRISLFILSFLLFFFLSLHATRSRKEEIYSLNYIGIKRRKILPRLLLELLFPVLLSLPFIFCVLLMFHHQVIDKSIEINQQVLKHYFQSEEIAHIPKEKKASVITSNEETKNKTTKIEPELIPYNQTSILDVDTSTDSLSHIFSMLVTNFMLLYTNMITAYIAGFYCYTTIGFRRRRLIE